MKKILFLFLLLFNVYTIMAQGILDKVKTVVQSSSGSSSKLSNDEIIGGLKEALQLGADSSIKKLGGADGFFKNAALKILMPPEAQKAESTLRKFGMGSLVDKAILSMNRAAEDATSGVGVIFADAIRQMTIADGLQILKGGDTAATTYLKKSTSNPLTEKMKPVIEQSLSKVNATSHWKDVFSAYNKLTRSNVNTDLSGYVTAKAMDGIFYSIAQEEKKIRKDPAGQASTLIQKVFANK
jgi:hypothetical protein